LVVIAKATAKEGMVEELERVLQDAVSPTLEEDGNHGFRVHHVLDDPASIVVVENWDSKAAWQAHLETPHIKRVGELVGDLLAQPFEVLALTPTDS
jgi:quinol monooxygenase YgiN